MRLGEHPVARGPDTAIDRLGENPHLLIAGRETYKIYRRYQAEEEKRTRR